jgi:hypothetical protein
MQPIAAMNEDGPVYVIFPNGLASKEYEDGHAQPFSRTRSCDTVDLLAAIQIVVDALEAAEGRMSEGSDDFDALENRHDSMEVDERAVDTWVVENSCILFVLSTGGIPVRYPCCPSSLKRGCRCYC